MKATVASVLSFAITLSVLGQTPPKVPDSSTAIRLAETALVKVYGKKTIDAERPFTASLSDGIWHVSGTLYCQDEKGNRITNACVGGVAMADIRQRDGRVLRTSHTK
jgi:hypothetical protein